jgi:hypothetical protein
LAKRFISESQLREKKEANKVHRIGYNSNMEAIRNIEIITESIPQFIFQVYVFNHRNDILVTLYNNKWQLLFLIFPICSIVFGLKSLRFELFYYFEPEEIKATKSRHFASVLWYLLIVIPRLWLISMILFKSYLMFLIFLVLSIIINIIIYLREKNLTEKDNFFSKKFLNNVFYYFLLCCYQIFGIYKNPFLRVKNYYETQENNPSKIMKQHNHYILYYVFFLMVNAGFSIGLWYFYNLNIILTVFFSISNLIAFFIQYVYEKIENSTIWVAFVTFVTRLILPRNSNIEVS